MNTLITSASAVHQVDIKDIDVRPGAYCMSFGFDLAPLTESIQRVGLINNPVLIRDGTEKLTIIVGYRRIHALKNRFLNVLIKSHPDQGEVQLFEILTGVVFGIITLSMAQISFLGLSLAFVLFPLMHRLTWDNRLISKLVYLPFSIILIGLMIGAASAFGMQTVFFGYGFHF